MKNHTVINISETTEPMQPFTKMRSVVFSTFTCHSFCKSSERKKTYPLSHQLPWCCVCGLRPWQQEPGLQQAPRGRQPPREDTRTRPGPLEHQRTGRRFTMEWVRYAVVLTGHFIRYTCLVKGWSPNSSQHTFNKVLETYWHDTSWHIYDANLPFHHTPKVRLDW